MSANTPRSRKAKGRSFQNEIRTVILKSFPQLEPDDVKCALMSETGEDIKLSPAAKKIFPYSIEAKRQETLQIWAALKQAQENAKENTVPVLIFRRNNSKPYVAFPLEDFMKLVQNNK